jgi:hypothetical protein
MQTVKNQILYYQIIIGAMGGLALILFTFLCIIICHYHRKFKRIATTVGIPTLLKRVNTLGGNIATLGIHTLNANELNEKTGKLDVNNKA